MKLPIKKAEFLHQTINFWEANNTVTPEDAKKLRASFEAKKFDWKRLAAYSFWIAIICGIIAFVAILADDLVMNLIEKLFDASYVALSIFMAVMAAIFYYLGHLRRKSKPSQVYTNESILFRGVLCTATSIGFLGEALNNGSGHFSLLLLLSTVVYSVLGLWFSSKLIWTFSLICLGSWFGTETGYISGWGAYFLGMNYPMRFVLFGAILTAMSFAFKRSDKLAPFQESTYVIGLLYLFISLWLLSLFGNYGSMTSWHDVRQIELFHWGLIFGFVALGTILYGLKMDNRTARGFGITFLFINLYTKYFEFFWDGTHKALFFFVLGLSFWLLGRKAEKIWTVDFFQNKEQDDLSGN